MLRSRFVQRALSSGPAAAAAATTATTANKAAPSAAAAATTAAAATKAALSPFAASTAVFAAANALGFGISIATGWHYHLDLIGTGAFAVAAVATAGVETRQRASAACIGLWAAKLAGFLFYRALQTHHDGRLTDILAKPSGAAGFWTISAAWGVVVSLPHTLAAAVPAAARPAFGLPADLLGLALFAAGLWLETTADYQKWKFKQARLESECPATGRWLQRPVAVP